MTDNRIDNDSIMDEHAANETGISDAEPVNQSGETAVDEQNSETEKLAAELKDTKEKYLRLVAEFDNFRKRNARERIETIQTASKDVIVSLLDVLDDAERAQQQLEPASTDQAIQGVVLVFNKLKNILLSKGLKVMDAKGAKFNPDLHEAIAEVDAGKEMKEKVVEVLQNGYYLNDKIIRFAKVVVGK
jgi:molecular chaperone GrpE